MTAPASLAIVPGDTSQEVVGVDAVLSHPALRLPLDQWPAEAWMLQEACGIWWDWSDIRRFAKYVERKGNCLLWRGGRSRGKGNKQWYGSFWVRAVGGRRGKSVRAHKFAAVAILGLRPAQGQEVDHGCHATRCVSCLSVLSQQANQAKIRRPKKRHLDLAKRLCITPAEVMALPEIGLMRLEGWVKALDEQTRLWLDGDPNANPLDFQGLLPRAGPKLGPAT